MNMQMKLFSCRTTGCKDLTYHIRNDITTCNNADFGMKSVDLWIFLSCFKDFITIHEYAKNIICITYHVIIGECLSFNLVPSLVV